MSRDADSWDDPYGAEVYADVAGGGELYPRLARTLVEWIGPAAGKRLLDLACGSGLVVAEALAAGAAQVVGLDRATAMAAVARRQLPEGAAAFAAGEPGRLPFADASFDGATCSAALWHFPGLSRSFRELTRCLRPGARFAFDIPAAQLRGEADLPPAPLQLALARWGERLFHAPPAPGGPELEREALLSQARIAGLSLVRDEYIDILVSQQEMADLIQVPAIGGRFYPAATDEERESWLRQASERLNLSEKVPVRWWCVLLEADPIFPPGAPGP